MSVTAEKPVQEDARTYMSPEQTAEYLGIGRSTLYRLMDEAPRLPRLKLGKSVRFYRADVDAWAQQLKERTMSDPAA